MRFLIVKTSSLGDVIQALPVVAYLKEKYPGCTIDWVVEAEYASLLMAYLPIARVITISTRKWRKCKQLRDIYRNISFLREEHYDVVFDLQGNTKSAVVTLLSKADQKVGFGRDSAPEWPNRLATTHRFEVSPTSPIQSRYLSIVQQFFSDPVPFQNKPITLILTEQEKRELAYLRVSGCRRMMVAFASKWENKCLSIATWLQFLTSLSNQTKTIFYFVSGTEREKRVADQFAAHFPGSFSLSSLSFSLWQNLMTEMDQVISVDSAALALCGTTSTPSLSFFGPTQAAVYKPMGVHHRAFQGTCPYGVTFSSRCPLLRTCKTGACLKDAESFASFPEISPSPH